MTVVEVHDAEVIDFDLERAKRSLARIEVLIGEHVRSGIALADELFEARAAQPWKIDDDYRAIRASGGQSATTRVNQDGDPSVHEGATWFQWKFNRDWRYLYRLAAYGELRAIIAADPELPQITEPEAAARSAVAKLLGAKPSPSEVRNGLTIDDRDEAIRRAWRLALDRSEDQPAKAVVEVLRPVVLKNVEYQPLRRVVEPSPAEKTRRKQAQTARAVKQIQHAVAVLIRAEQWQTLRETLAAATATSDEARSRG